MHLWLNLYLFDYYKRLIFNAMEKEDKIIKPKVKYVEKDQTKTKKKYITKQQALQKQQFQAIQSIQYETNKQQQIQKKVEQKSVSLNQNKSKVPLPLPKIIKTTVINVKVKFLREMGYQSLLDWLKNPQHVYIGRGMTNYVPGAVQSKWANPFKVDKYGRQGCIQQYKTYILQNKQLLRQLPTLKGKVLGCWCKPQGCHGDILAQLADNSI